MKFGKLLNPFEKLSELSVLTVGLTAIPIAAVGSWKVGGMFSDFANFSGGASGVEFWRILAVQASLAVVCAAVFAVLAKLFSKSKPKVAIVSGYAVFALSPLALVPLFYIPQASGVWLSPPMPLSQQWIAEHWTFRSATLILSSILPIVWCWILLFNALKMSAKIRGFRLFSAFALGFVGVILIMRAAVFPEIIMCGRNFAIPTESTPENATKLAPWSSVLGMYEGVLKFPSQTLRFRLYTDNDGKFSAFATSPDQSSQKIELNDIQISEDKNGAKLTFSAPKYGIKFSGHFTSNDGRKIKGTFSQNGFDVPVSLTKKQARRYTTSRKYILPENAEVRPAPFPEAFVKLAPKNIADKIARELSVSESKDKDGRRILSLDVESRFRGESQMLGYAVFNSFEKFNKDAKAVEGSTKTAGKSVEIFPPDRIAAGYKKHLAEIGKNDFVKILGTMKTRNKASPIEAVSKFETILSLSDERVATVFAPLEVLAYSQDGKKVEGKNAYKAEIVFDGKISREYRFPKGGDGEKERLELTQKKKSNTLFMADCLGFFPHRTIFPNLGENSRTALETLENPPAYPPLAYEMRGNSLNVRTLDFGNSRLLFVVKNGNIIMRFLANTFDKLSEEFSYTGEISVKNSTLVIAKTMSRRLASKDENLQGTIYRVEIESAEILKNFDFDAYAEKIGSQSENGK